MRSWLLMFFAIGLAALSLASLRGAAAQGAEKLPLRIDIVEEGVVWLGTDATDTGRFSLVGASAADTDSGKFVFTFSSGGLTKTGDGQSFQPLRHSGTAAGKRGTLVIRSTGRQLPVLGRGGLLGGFSANNYVLSGTWSLARGTGKYAGLKGGGAFVATMLTAKSGTDEFDFSYRYEGFVKR
jgi:hypothetical protein